MAKVIKLTDNNNNTLLPVTDASYIQMKVGDDVRSVKDVIIENEEITALALNDLHSTKQEKLISGVTIKTINDESLIGAGDINLPEVYDVRFVFSSDSWVCNHTYSEINTAFNDGKLIVGVVGTSGNSPRIDGYSIPFGPLDFGDMTNIPDYCFLTAVRQTASPPYELFSMIMEYSSTERILITFKIDSNDVITVHAESIGTGEVSTITEDNSILVSFSINSSGTGVMDIDPYDLYVATTSGKSIIGKFDYRTLNNYNFGTIIPTSLNYPSGLLLSIWSNGVVQQQGSTKRGVDVVFYDEYIKFNVDIDADTSTNTATATITPTFYSNGIHSLATHDHDARYNGIWSSSVSTEATTVPKKATVSGWRENNGNIVELLFTKGNTAASPTLSINNGTAYPIRHKGGAAVGTDIIKANDRVTLLYWNSAFYIISINTWGERVTASNSNITNAYITGVTGATNQAPVYDTGVYLTTTSGELRATIFNENGTMLAAKYASLLKYTVKAASSGSAAFTNSSKMQPNTVYVIGSGSNPFSFTSVSSVVLASGSTSLLANDIGMMWSTGQASNITDNMTVPMYQMVFKASASGVSFTMPSSIKWKDGSAPDERATANKMCELTIINNIATINII